MRRVFRRMMPYRKQFWYVTWDRAHLTTAERREARKRLRQ